MKNILYFLSICVSGMLLGCEEPITVDLDTAAPRLVIEASINWQKGSDGSQQKILLTTTAPYYNSVIPKVSGATVFITNSTNDVFNFVEVEPNSGAYLCNNFVPVIGETYQLTVIQGGQTYKATEKLIKVPAISGVTQRSDVGLTGSDIEVKFLFQDDGSEDNFYLSRYDTTVNAFPEYGVDYDLFQQGNVMFGLYFNEDIGPGDKITYTLYGISQLYYNYMNKLLSVSGINGGSPFQTPPATVRGNITNQTDPSNYPLGFFRLSETDSREYTVQ